MLEYILSPVSEIPYKFAIAIPSEYSIDLIMLLPRSSASNGNPDAGAEIGIVLGVTLTVIFIVILIPTIYVCRLLWAVEIMSNKTLKARAAASRATKEPPVAKSAYRKVAPKTTANKPGPFADTAPMMPPAAYMGDGDGDGEYEMTAYGEGGMGTVRTETEEWECK